MTQSALEIERIVRDVLARLAEPDAAKSAVPAEKPAAAAAATCPAPALPAPVADAPSDGRMVLSSRVVTLGQLDGRLGDIRQLVVPRGAVVTPAVRDELDRRRINLIFADRPEAAAPVAPGALRLVVAKTGTGFDPGALVKSIEAQGVLVVSHALDCLIASVDLLAHQVQEGKTLGLLLTRHAAAGLCLANRLPGVRAVEGQSPDRLAAAADAVGANLLVVDPQALGLFPLKQMVLEYCRGGVRPCPSVFAKRLG